MNRRLLVTFDKVPRGHSPCDFKHAQSSLAVLTSQKHMHCDKASMSLDFRPSRMNVRGDFRAIPVDNLRDNKRIYLCYNDAVSFL